jgi:hypothetical protein
MSHLKGIAFESPEVQLQKLRERLRFSSTPSESRLARNRALHYDPDLSGLVLL